ncbi:SDR family oxidoreductase [Streptomyces sp. N2A]|uniref:SDR family oxidoreductase n=1 Tax=Streptomyces sp. N2A TaxID=3073936 RepID=UPI00286FB9C6|nr:SDR family oxidoreductase [Streptomyces sp. N2A]
MNGKKAIVIGASHGWGAFLGGRLAEEGWEVTAIGRRSKPDLPDSAALRYLQADLATADGYQDVERELREQAPTLVVYNAVSYGPRDAKLPPLADLEATFKINALVPYHLLLNHVNQESSAEFCTYVVTNSDSIYHANKYSGIYAASKAALRVLTAALASACQSHHAAAATLLLGPLADKENFEKLQEVAERTGADLSVVTRRYLGKSNQAYVINSFLSYESCVKSVLTIASLGRDANGMLCKVDGGSSGSLV